MARERRRAEDAETGSCRGAADFTGTANCETAAFPAGSGTGEATGVTSPFPEASSREKDIGRRRSSRPRHLMTRSSRLEEPKASISSTTGHSSESFETSASAADEAGLWTSSSDVRDAAERAERSSSTRRGIAETGDTASHGTTELKTAKPAEVRDARARISPSASANGNSPSCATEKAERTGTSASWPERTGDSKSKPAERASRMTDSGWLSQK